MRVMVLFDVPQPANEDETFSPEILRRQEFKSTENVLQSLRKLGHAVEILAVFDNVAPILEKVKSVQPECRLQHD